MPLFKFEILTVLASPQTLLDASIMQYHNGSPKTMERVHQGIWKWILRLGGYCFIGPQQSVWLVGRSVFANAVMYLCSAVFLAEVQ